MTRLERLTVELTLPFFGKIGGQWIPDAAERRAAWEMYVELGTRVTLYPLATNEGLIREALNSYYSLFETTRVILRNHGPGIARPARHGDLSFGHLALAVLNGGLRPLLTRWHPDLLAHEHRRPADHSATMWEDSWVHAAEVRQEIESTRRALSEYADILAIVAEVPPLHSHP